MGVFLEMNGVRLVASNDDAYDMVIAVADGTADRAKLTDWLRAHSVAD